MNATKNSHFLNCPPSLADARPKDLCLLMRQAPARSKVSLPRQGASPLTIEMNCPVSPFVISFLHKQQTPAAKHAPHPGSRNPTGDEPERASRAHSFPFLPHAETGVQRAPTINQTLETQDAGLAAANLTTDWTEIRKNKQINA